MNEKPEALRLAEILDGGSHQFNLEAAAELRRLHVLCAEWEMKAANWLASPEAAKRLEGYRSLGARCAELEAECEALRADAMRYRWLRSASGDWGICAWGRETCEWVRDSRGAVVVNEAIDAAMAKEQTK